MAADGNQQIGGDDMSNDQYSAPVTAERQDNLKRRTEEQRDRFARFLHHPLDSIEVNGLADELEDLAQQYRAVASRSNDEHQDQTVREYRVVVESVSSYSAIIEATDAEKWAVAKALDGGEFTELGEGSWQVQSVELYT